MTLCRAVEAVCQAVIDLLPGTTATQSRSVSSSSSGRLLQRAGLRLDPVGFLGPVLAAPPTGAEALRLWDAVVALAAVPGVLELSRPRPPLPEIPGLRLPKL